MRKKFLWILCTFAIIVAVAGVSWLLLTHSETGSRLAVKTLASRWQDRISIGDVHGTLSSGIDISNLLLRNGGSKAQVRQARMDLNPKGLLSGKLIINRLLLKGVTLTVPEGEAILKNTATDDAPPFSYPMPILLEDVVIEDVAVQHADRTYHLHALDFAASGDSEGLHIKSLMARTEHVALSIRGNATINPQLKIDGSLMWRAVLPNQMISRGQSDISGDIRQMELAISTVSPLAIETRADLTVNESWTQYTLVGKPLKSVKPLPIESQPIVKTENTATDIPAPSDTAAPKRPDHPESDVEYCSGESICLMIKNLKAKTLSGEVKIDGVVRLLPHENWSLTLDGYGIDPGRRWPALHGKIDLHAAIQGKMVQGKPVAGIKDLVLSGELFEQPVQVTGNVELKESGLPLTDGLLVQSGNNRIELKGDAGSLSGLSFSANLANPESLWPGLKGKLIASGLLKTEGKKLRGEAAFEGHAAGYGAFETERIHGSMHFDSEDDIATGGSVEVTHLRAKDELFSRLKLAWEGNLARHESALHVESSSTRADIEMQGECNGKTWKAVVSKASLNDAGYGAWQLANPVQLVLTHTELKPVEACWVKKGRTACANAAWQSETGWTTGGDLEKAPIDAIAAWIHLLPDSPYGKLVGMR
jgi:autotransporter translocation and assembly factor TamB